MRQRGARTRTQRAVNKCPFSPSPPPFPRPPPSQFQPQLVPGTRPQLASALPGWGRRPPSTGIRGSLTCSSRLPPAARAGAPVFSPRRAPSPSPGMAGRWPLRLSAPPQPGSVQLSSPPGTPQGALDPGRGFLGARRSRVRSTGSAAAEGPGLWETEAGGVRALLHSVEALGGNLR